MNIEIFHKFLNRIDADLTKEENLLKQIQIADSINFIEFLDNSFKLIECTSYPFNIFQKDKNRFGVLFCELSIIDIAILKPYNQNNFETSFYKEQIGIDEFWFVFVEDKICKKQSDYLQFIEKHQLKHEFDSFFLFNYQNNLNLKLK